MLVLGVVRDILSSRPLRVWLRGGQMRRLHIHIRLCLVHASSRVDDPANSYASTYTDTRAVCSDRGRALGLAAGLRVAREAGGRVLMRGGRGGGRGRRGRRDGRSKGKRWQLVAREERPFCSVVVIPGKIHGAPGVNLGNRR